MAIQQINRVTVGARGNPLKFDRRIVVVTDGRGEMDTADLDAIVSKIKDPAALIDITLLGVDFDDADNGFKEEDKDPTKVCSSSIQSHRLLIVNRKRMK